MKKNMTMKVTALAAASIMALSTAACTGNTASTPSPSANTTAPAGEATAPAGGDATAAPEVAPEIPKPEKIMLMMDTAFGSMLLPSTWEAFNAKYKEMTGIEIVMAKPDHQQYYEQLNLAFTSGNPPDVMEIGTTNYPTYATNGALWDHTAAWENSELKASGNVTEKYVDALKIDGVLYGFPMAKGNGTVTYLRQDWLDKLNLKVPTNYEEFLTVLRGFTNDDPDGNGVKDTYGITAAGLVNTETPYDIYLREFYQNARPDFYLKDGAYVDGMSEPEMLAALQRMKDAYNEGLIDKEIITNKTSTARDKFYASQVGAFNYWAGVWNVTLENNLQAANPSAKMVAIPPIAETSYIERPPLSMSISSSAKNPEGIFKYLIEFSHDSGEGQLLFTRGIEGINYEKQADGTYIQLPDPENPDKVFEKTYYAPELSYTNFVDIITFEERVTSTLEMFEANSNIYPVPRVSDVISSNLPELVTIKNTAVANCVTGTLSPEEAVTQYQTLGKMYIDAILADLNK